MATYEDLVIEVEDHIYDHFTEVLPTRDEVKEMASLFLKIVLKSSKFKEIADQIDRDKLVDDVFTKYWEEQSIRQSKAHFLVDSDSNVPWLPELDVDWHYWEQYRNYLERHEHWSKSVCESISQDTYQILSLTANPEKPESFRKQGLVVGNVQSGKTANYLGLMCRAADVGYKYIVVLAATTNDLRAQTQQRIEEGMIGYETSSPFKGQLPQRREVGVGERYHGKTFRHPNPGTTRKDDFNKSKMETLMQLGADNVTEPWVFVIKKNPRTLKNLIGWLKSNKLDGASLFLIDDEADNASINTKHSKEEISKINEQIRGLLELFDKRVYVGYTATPYANILIDKDDIDEQLGKDLFPRNFIFTLSPADSYFGADKIFEDIEPDDGQYVSKPKYIRFIDDIDLMPPSGKDYEIPALPRSVLDAIRTFVVSSALRVKDAGYDCHTTMLFNMSPYNKIQKRLKNRVDEYLADTLKPAIAAFGKSSPDVALRNSREIRALKDRWDYEFGDLETSWEEVFPHIDDIVAPLRTALINSKSQDALAYNEQTEHVIAFGGYRLSRGLTLSGLITSYFSRNSRAYDTLMQMSRWFGHRPGYEYLCRIWMTEESAGWCRFVADATDDLMDDLIVMQRQSASPLEFGHKIRSHPGTLIVTARNKMGGGELRGDVCLNGRLIETTVLPRESTSAAKDNWAAAQDLQLALEQGGYEYQVSNGCDDMQDEIGAPGVLFKHIPYELVERFVENYTNENDSMLTKPDSVARHIGYCLDDGKRYWDVFFAAASDNKHETEKTFECAGRVLYRQRRSPGTRTTTGKAFIGNRSKVASKGIDGIGLSLKDRTIAEQEYAMYEAKKKAGEMDRHPSQDKLYRFRRDRPLLVIHYLDVRFKADSNDYEKAIGKIQGGDKRYGPLKVSVWPSAETSEDLVAWSMSLPQLSRDRHVEYVFNKVALQNMDFGDDTEDEDEGIDDDE